MHLVAVCLVSGEQSLDLSCPAEWRRGGLQRDGDAINPLQPTVTMYVVRSSSKVS